jgi:hypothetical protein
MKSRLSSQDHYITNKNEDEEEQKEYHWSNTKLNNNNILIYKSQVSPYSRFIYALNAPESKRQYPKRIQVFLDFLKIENCQTIEDKANKFYDLFLTNGSEWLETQLIRFFTLQNSRVDNGEITAGTIENYYNPVKLFCGMNNILLNWKFISRGIKKCNENSADRPPSLKEIKQLMEYPDRRMKPIVLTMISSGIRVGSWDHLK